MPRHTSKSFLSAVILAVALATVSGLASCNDSSSGAARVAVIGSGTPKLVDPSSATLAPGTAELLESAAQGLVAFDANGEIADGLAERWAVSDDGLSYIFRLGSANWSDGSKVTARQIAKLLRQVIAQNRRNPAKTNVRVEDVRAMTDRVIELRLANPQPELLTLLAQPELALVRDGHGTGPFTIIPGTKDKSGAVLLERERLDGDGQEPTIERVRMVTIGAADAIAAFKRDETDLVLGGTFDTLSLAQGADLPRGSLRFDPASGLFGLIPVSRGDRFDQPDVRRLLSRTIDREMLVDALQVPGLVPRATLLEPDLDGANAPTAPDWMSVGIADRRAAALAEARLNFAGEERPTLRIILPDGPGGDIIYRRLREDWGWIGLNVERAKKGDKSANFELIDLVAPSASAGWFVAAFSCALRKICDKEVDQELAKIASAQSQADRTAAITTAAHLIDTDQLFIPFTAPVRWSLVGKAITGFAENRYARHTLSGLKTPAGRRD